MSDELPELNRVSMTELVAAYLKQEGYEFEDTEEAYEWAMINHVQLDIGSGTHMKIPMETMGVEVSTDPHCAKEKKRK